LPKAVSCKNVLIGTKRVNLNFLSKTALSAKLLRLAKHLSQRPRLFLETPALPIYEDVNLQKGEKAGKISIKKLLECKVNSQYPPGSFSHFNQSLKIPFVTWSKYVCDRSLPIAIEYFASKPFLSERTIERAREPLEILPGGEEEQKTVRGLV